MKPIADGPIDLPAFWRDEYARDAICLDELEDRLETWFRCVGNDLSDEPPNPSMQEMIEIDRERQRVALLLAYREPIGRQLGHKTTLAACDAVLKDFYVGPIQGPLDRL